MIDVATWVLLSLGTLFCLIGAVGVLRMPDFYTRTHPATIVDTLGAGLILTGLALQVGEDQALIAVKLVMIVVFILLSSPTAAHALVKAAYARGVRVDVEVEDRTDDVAA